MNASIETGQREPTQRILVVDDEQSILDFIEMGLSYEGYTVETAADGRAALEAARREWPDLVILDVMLPEIDGLEVCRRLRAQNDVPIIMLTARGAVDDRVAGLDSGADDYLPKPFMFKELLARVRAQLRRRYPGAGRILRYGDLVLNRETREVQRAGTSVELAPKEFDLLELFMAHPRQVFTREVIMDSVWGYDYVGETNVIDVHISYLRDKLGDTDRTLIRTMRGVGYSLRG
ncbi:MAG: response regulator transcription factor [Chloroflexi bacterium]|nr:response regulator transcription factor [Chloroflexota bacterium]